MTGADRTRTVRRLERGEGGVDVDALHDDFVTYQAIRSYLKRDRDAEYAKPDKDRIESELENLQRLRGRVTTVTEGNLEQLRRNEEIRLGEFGLLDSLEVIDSKRIARPVEYLTDYTGYLLVALLPEDATGLPEEYARIAEI